MKHKRKLNKRGIILLISIFILIIGGVVSIKYIKYINSYEYKFKELGYSKDNIDYFVTLDTEKKEYLLKIDYNEEIINILKQKYFLWKNIDKYIEYYNSNKDKSFDNIISIINVGSDKEWYTNTKTTDISNKTTMLVNKFHSLPDDYDEMLTEEDLLTNISNWYSYGSHKIMKEVYENYKEMSKVADGEGLKLIINSGYRTNQLQIDIYQEKKDSGGLEYADNYAARPGFSEHQTGLALDIFTPKYSTMSTFQNSPEYDWLIKNAHKYGFILRYPEGKEHITGYSYEPWHYRYVGKDLASKVFESGLTYDEYYAYYME